MYNPIVEEMKYESILGNYENYAKHTEEDYLITDNRVCNYRCIFS